MFHKFLLSKEDNLRVLRALLRDTIFYLRHSKQEFDISRFTFELLDDIRKKCAEFVHFEQQLRERFVISICDLITVCIFISISKQVKEAYSKRSLNESKEILNRFYQLISSIQCETVTWLQAIVRYYDINPKERITCLYKVLFMHDKSEIYYSIDGWPMENERAIIFRILAEIPVLYETLYQVLLIADTLPANMLVFMLEVEERLLKTAALIQYKDQSGTVKLFNIDDYLQALFKIALYKYPSEYDLMLPRSFNPPVLAVNGLYWKTWQILLILTALDCKNFGSIAWDNYPTLKMLMEIIMTEDYNFPPQCSLTTEFTIDKYRAIENQVSVFFRKI